MSFSAVLTPTKNRNRVVDFLSSFIPKKTTQAKIITKDSDWVEHLTDYEKLVTNLDFYNLDGSISSKASSNDIDFKYLLESCRVQNPDIACLTCMDEGVQYLAASHNIIPIALPGCGILMVQQQQELRDNILELLKKYGIKKLVVDSHAKCGAAGIAAKKEFTNLSCIHSEDFMDKLTELVADDYANHLADNLHKDFADLEVTSNYITELERPDFHNAMGVLVNFDSEINSSLVIQKLKIPLFALSAHILDEDSLAEDDSLAYQIATGGHGYGEKFCPEKPFLILFATKTEDQKQAALKIVEKMESKCHVQYSFI